MSTENSANAVMQDMFGVFNKPAESVNFQKEEDGSGGIFFNPDSKNSPNQTFRGVIKFLPNLHDPENMTVSKVTYRVPEGTGSFRFDSPKSLDKYADCPVAKVYWDLKNSKDARKKAKADKIYYSRKTFALIQVIKDMTNPENNGKVMVWDLPYAIQKKIKSKMYPSKEDVELGAESNNVFDPINGIPMILNIPIKKVGDSEFRDYDPVDWHKEPMTMMLEGEDTLVKLSDNPEELKKQQEAMLKTILAGPNLQDLAYQAPSADTLQRVSKALAALLGEELPEVKDAPKSDAQGQVQAETKSDVQSEPKAEAPAEPKPEVKEEPKADTAGSPAAETSKEDAELLKELGL